MSFCILPHHDEVLAMMIVRCGKWRMILYWYWARRNDFVVGMVMMAPRGMLWCCISMSRLATIALAARMMVVTAWPWCSRIMR